MAHKILIDTNVLVYAFDKNAPRKQKQSIDLLQATSDRGVGLLSTQILGEFFNAVTKKLTEPLTFAMAQKEVHHFLEAWATAPVTEMTVIEAMRGVKEYGFSYWDSQLWATALLNQAAVVLSEDFQDGFDAEGVRFLNPFHEKFELSSLV